MSQELFSHLISELHQLPNPRGNKELMRAIGTFIAINVGNEGHPFGKNDLLPRDAVDQMEEIIASESKNLDRDHPLYGTLTWAAEWWGRIYQNDAIYPPTPSGDIIPRADFEAMLASGELVKNDKYNGVYQMPTGQYVVILKLPNGDGVIPASQSLDHDVPSNDLFDATGIDAGSDAFMFRGEQAGLEKLLTFTKNWPRGCAVRALVTTACDILVQVCPAEEQADAVEDVFNTMRARIQWNAFGRHPEMWRAPGT